MVELFLISLLNGRSGVHKLRTHFLKFLKIIPHIGADTDFTSVPFAEKGHRKNCKSHLNRPTNTDAISCWSIATKGLIHLASWLATSCQPGLADKFVPATSCPTGKSCELVGQPTN